MSDLDGALLSFARRWRLDGDYIRCVRCKRPHLASWAHKAFDHAPGCKIAKAESAGAQREVESHPWLALQRIVAALPSPSLERAESAGGES